MRSALALAILVAACGRRPPPAGVRDLGEAARLLFASLEADDFERVRILLPTAEERAGLERAAKTDFRAKFERTRRDPRLHWEVAVYRGYVHEGRSLVLYVEAGRDREEFYDIHFIVERVARGWVLCGPFYCAGLRDRDELPPLER